MAGRSNKRLAPKATTRSDRKCVRRYGDRRHAAEHAGNSLVTDPERRRSQIFLVPDLWGIPDDCEALTDVAVERLPAGAFIPAAVVL